MLRTVDAAGTGALDRGDADRHCCVMTDVDATIAEMSFEAALKALEDIVRRLESGDVSLDDSITLYEDGEKLRQHCQKRLDAAQARIERIVQGPDGSAVDTQPFDSESR